MPHYSRSLISMQFHFNLIFRAPFFLETSLVSLQKTTLCCASTSGCHCTLLAGASAPGAPVGMPAQRGPCVLLGTLVLLARTESLSKSLSERLQPPLPHPSKSAYLPCFHFLFIEPGNSVQGPPTKILWVHGPAYRKGIQTLPAFLPPSACLPCR